jgi:hypothetical protein
MWQQNRLCPFEDEYSQGQLSQHVLKLTKPETPITIIIVLMLSIKCLLERHHGRVARKGRNQVF